MTAPTPCACPFCGSANTWVRPETGGHRGVCNDCHARGSLHPTVAGAKMGWNRVARMPAQIEATRRTVQALADQLHPGVA